MGRPRKDGRVDLLLQNAAENPPPVGREGNEVRVADTSALYAFLVETDGHHTKAATALTNPDPIVVPTEILLETVQLLAYRFGWDAGRLALDALLSLPHVSVAEKVSFDGVRQVHAASKGRLSLADAFVVQTCRALGATPIAYDANIVKAARP